MPTYKLARTPVLATIASVVMLTACQDLPASKSADLMVVNAKIYTLAEPEWAESMAITNGRISYIGSVEGAEKLVGPVSQRLDLDGRMVMPGINDAHLHPVDGALKALYRCNFPFTAGPLEVQSAVLECVRNSGDQQWIIGGQWDSDFFVNNDVASPRGLLDEVSDDKAVFLRADSGHDAWLNSKGLELAGINKHSHQPEGGTIVRDEKGEPNGLLLEKAKYAAEKKLPANTEEQYVNAARELIQIANAYGVTGMKDASAEEADVKSLTALASSGELTAHMATSLRVRKEDWTAAGFDTSRLLRVRDQYTNNNVDTRHVKIFMDGVPTSSRTAAMLMNYLPVSEQEPAHNGDVHFSLVQLSEMLITLDALGFTVKIHTAGDRSVRMALDAIEITREKNGRSGLRHELAHAGYIHPDDISRFRPLNAVADLSPYIWYPSPIIDSVLRAVGPRGERYWPMRALIAANAPILAGSDWPAAVSSMNPWVGIEAMVTRANPNDETEGELWPEQALSLAEALRVFTLGGAKALRLEQETGSLETGKLADFIVLNKNLFEQASSEIGSTEVEATFFEGKLVYSRDQVLFNIVP